MEPSVVASRHGSYRCLFDRRSGLLARFATESPLPGPELIEVSLVGPGGELFELGALRRLLDAAPLCRQVMLVGASESHPGLASILRTIRDHGVVPSVVVSSPRPKPAVTEAISRFAGFVSIDCGFGRAQIGLMRTYRDLGSRVVLHLPLADSTVDWIASSVEGTTFEHNVQSVVLTGRTATGAQAQGTGLNAGPQLDRLVELCGRAHPYRIATDARIAPYMAGDEIGHAATISRCEAARSGLFVDHDLTVTPCSLVAGQVLGSLNDASLDAIWTSKAARDFRANASLATPPCFGGSAIAPPARERRADPTAEIAAAGVEVRFGFASSSLCDRALPPLGRAQILHILASVKDWRALRFFTDQADAAPTQVAASWSSLEYFLSLPSMWGQDLARLHEQLVAGTFEGQVGR